MPLDTRVAEYVRALALERGISLSDARRVLIEQIDHSKRLSHIEGRTAVTGVRTPGERGNTRLQLPNPFRRHVDPSPPEEQKPAPRKSLKSPGTPTRETPEKEKTENRPIPGTIEGMIWGALNNPEKDFNGAFLALKSTHRFDDLTDEQIRFKILKVAWHYGILLR